MVELFGKIESSEVVDDQNVMNFKIPAVSQTLARRRGLFNGRVKGLQDREVTDVEVVRQGQIPGQKIFSVEVTGSR